MRGGSDDLMDAARAPDGGAAGGETWYRGTAADKPLEPGLGGAIWLSDNADVANRYSADAYLRTRQRGQVYDFPQVQPRNPLEIDMRGEPIMALYGRLRRDLGVEGEYADVLRQVRERGHDAIVIRNVRDQYTPGGRGGPQTQLAVLDPAILGEPHVFGRPWRAPDAPNAARAPDGGASGAGNAYREQLRAEGFDVDRPLFHGTTADFDEFSTATLRDERGIHLADDHETANFFAGMGQNGRVVPVYVRGRLREHVGPTGSAVDGTIRLAREAGDAGVIVTYPGTARTGFRPRREIIVFDPANIRPQIGRAPDAPNAGPSRPPPRPRPPPRRPQR